MRLMSLLGALLLLIGYSSLALAAKLQLYTEEYRPLSYFDDGKLTGMAVEVVEQLIQVGPWTRGYHQVQREANTGLFSIVRTARRESLFQWVGPIALGHTSFYARRGAGLNVRSLKDVERFSTVAVPKQWYSYEYLSDKGLKNLYAVPTPQHMTKMFKHGRIELLVASSLALDDMLAEQGMSARDVELQFTLMGTNSYIAFSKNTDPALVQRWQQALDQLTRDGGLLRIHRRWFSDPNSMPVLAPAP